MQLFDAINISYLVMIFIANVHSAFNPLSYTRGTRGLDSPAELEDFATEIELPTEFFASLSFKDQQVSNFKLVPD